MRYCEPVSRFLLTGPRRASEIREVLKGLGLRFWKGLGFRGGFHYRSWGLNSVKQGSGSEDGSLEALVIRLGLGYNRRTIL